MSVSNEQREALVNMGIEIINIAAKLVEDDHSELSGKLDSMLNDLHLELQTNQMVQLKIPQMGMVTRILGQEALFVRGGGKAFFWNMEEGVFYG